MANDVAKCISANDIRHGDSVVLGSTASPLNNNKITESSTSALISDIESRWDVRFDDPTYYGESGLLVDIVVSYRLDEISGVRKDSSGHSRDLTDNNTVGSIIGKVDRAADFTASNSEYFSLPDASLGGLSPGSSDFTISAWFNFKSLSQQFLAGVWKTSGAAHREWLLQLDSSNKINFFTSDNGSNETSVKTSAVSTDTWYHILVTHDNTGSSRHLYLNGTSVADDSNVTVYQGGGDFQIGNTQNSTDFMNGYVDEFNFWTRVLTASEIASLYNNGSGKHVR
jgi:hypothetical protein|tara:strand:+ start:196 stop:1044 length:849 start_codon:yes stop_codon:yes gene_type:complete